MIKYRASIPARIETKDVIRETKNYIVFKADKECFKNGERKESKESEYHKFFDDFVTAKNWLMDRQMETEKNLERRLENERAILDILNKTEFLNSSAVFALVIDWLVVEKSRATGDTEEKNLSLIQADQDINWMDASGVVSTTILPSAM